MPDRSWFYAAQGQQQGPFPEAQLRNLIARNMVTSETLVWIEGMADWQRAEDIPGLMSRTSVRPAVPPWCGPQISAGGPYNSGERYAIGGQTLSIDPGLWQLLRSNGRPLPITFNGSVQMYIGWHLLLLLSAITIVGWAWVLAQQTRWICRNISGTHRGIAFNVTGLEMLWRSIVFIFACAFIIPIPWALRWYVQWMVSQFELVERGA